MYKARPAVPLRYGQHRSGIDVPFIQSGFDEPLVEIGGNQANSLFGPRKGNERPMDAERRGGRCRETIDDRAPQDRRSQAFRPLQEAQGLVELRPPETRLRLIAMEGLPLDLIWLHAVSLRTRDPRAPGIREAPSLHRAKHLPRKRKRRWPVSTPFMRWTGILGPFDTSSGIQGSGLLFSATGEVP